MLLICLGPGLLLIEWYQAFDYPKGVISWVQGVATFARALTGTDKINVNNF